MSFECCGNAEGAGAGDSLAASLSVVARALRSFYGHVTDAAPRIDGLIAETHEARVAIATLFVLGSIVFFLMSRLTSNRG